MESSSNSPERAVFLSNSNSSQTDLSATDSDISTTRADTSSRMISAYRGSAHPLTILAASGLLFLLEGASVGMLLWVLVSNDVLIEYIHKNVISIENRRLLLSCMGIGACAPVLISIAYYLWRRKAALSPLRTASQLLAPLALSAFLPVLFNWELWKDKDLLYMALVSLVALGAQRAFFAFFSAVSVETTSTDLRARALREAQRRLRRLSSVVNPWLPLLIVAAFCIWYACFFSYYTVQNHRCLRTASFDLGLENNVVWNALHGAKLLVSSPLGGPDYSHFGYHATFFAYVIALVYAFHQDAETLLVLQSVIIALAAFPLFFYARRYIGTATACLLACAYLLYAPVHGANLYDFHYPPLAAFFLWSTLYFVDSGRYKLAAISVLLSLSIREDISIGVAIIGAFFILTGTRQKQGMVLMLVGIAYFAVVKFVVMPQALGGASAFTYVYKNLLPAGEHGFGGILKTIFGNPIYTLSTLLDRNKLIYFLQIMAPLAFIPLRRPSGWLFIIPGFLFTLLSTGYNPVIQISFQYTAHWTVYLFIAIVVILAKLAQARYPGDREGPVRKKAWIAAIALALLSTSYQHGALFQQNTVRGGFGRYNFTRSEKDMENYRSLYSLINRVPPMARIASSEYIVPHVSSRPNSYTLRVGVFDAEYMLFPNRVGRAEWKHIKPELRRKRFGIIEQAGKFYLAKRGAPTDRNRKVMKDIRH